MRITILSTIITTRKQLISRALSCSPVAGTKDWRSSQGLPLNRNAEGILTDGPDYTYLDGRPTPLLHKQKLRLIQQQNIASRIVQLSSELDFAKQRHQQMIKDEEEERQRIINNRLKPKGEAMLREKK